MSRKDELVDLLEPEYRAAGAAMVLLSERDPELLLRLNESHSGYAAGDWTAWAWVDDLWPRLRDIDPRLPDAPPEGWRLQGIFVLGVLLAVSR